MKEAIHKAIEGGYKKYDLAVKEIIDEDKNFEWRQKYTKAILLLDPLFWQCLGKALGWNQAKRIKFHKWDDTYDDMSCPEWKYHWHRFIDHLAEGKDVEEFFNQLLK